MLMQISRLYSNQPDLFTSIDFNCAEQDSKLNVVFATIKHPKDRKKDSHNLGKTTLLHLIDFMFLKGVTTSEHFLEVQSDLFNKFTFFMELYLNDGNYITIRRGVANNTRIAFKRAIDRSESYAELVDDEWDHVDIAIDKAIQILDGILDLSAIKPWAYRKGISYFLRSQYDYKEVLQLQKFSHGRDADWKPFVAHLFGYNPEPVETKYQLDLDLKELEERRSDRQAEVQIKEDDLSKIQTMIKLRAAEIEDIEERLDQFDFSEEEKRITKTIVEEIERDVSELNNSLYNLRSDINQIEHALQTGLKFRIKDVKRIFDESSVELPDQLVRGYEELLDFNRRLSTERNRSLKKQLEILTQEASALEVQRKALNARRRDYLKVLRGANTFEKFKGLQRELSDSTAELTYMRGQADKLRAVVKISDEINKLDRTRNRVVDEIGRMVREGNDTQEALALTFDKYVRRVLDLHGTFYVRRNAQGNMEFKVETELRGKSGSPSSQSRGKTYKQILCALFDLALLAVYRERSFYRFVYHDGILEALDDRKKSVFLDLVREVIAEGGIQYIMSAIDADLPRDELDQKVEFADDEIVLALHDDGESGRLFSMAEF